MSLSVALPPELPSYEPPPEWVPQDQRYGHPDYDNDLREFLPRVVTVRRDHASDALGFNLRGGGEFACGIFISKVQKNSEADRLGLKQGDQILAVNETSFEDIEHAQAVSILKSNTNVHMVIRFFPYAYQKTYERIPSTVSAPAQSTPPPVQQQYSQEGQASNPRDSYSQQPYQRDSYKRDSHRPSSQQQQAYPDTRSGQESNQLNPNAQDRNSQQYYPSSDVNRQESFQRESQRESQQPQRRLQLELSQTPLYEQDGQRQDSSPLEYYPVERNPQQTNAPQSFSLDASFQRRQQQESLESTQNLYNQQSQSRNQEQTNNRDSYTKERDSQRGSISQDRNQQMRYSQDSHQARIPPAEDRNVQDRYSEDRHQQGLNTQNRYQAERTQLDRTSQDPYPQDRNSQARYPQDRHQQEGSRQDMYAPGDPQDRMPPNNRDSYTQERNSQRGSISQDRNQQMRYSQDMHQARTDPACPVWN